MIRSRRRTAFALGALALSSAAFVPALGAQAKPSPKFIDVQILGLNDFHGQLEVVPATASSGGRIGNLTGSDASATCLPTSPSPCVPAGGVEYLATHVRNLRAENPNTVFTSAGDLIGATPLLSALFHDEPTIEAFNLLGLDYNGVGNHEFDEGVDELLRMQYGDRQEHGYEPASPDGCHPVDGCGDGDGFGGATFDFLAANVAYKDDGRTIFPPYEIHNFPGGGKVAFVGMTLEGTPQIVSPDGIASVDFLDEAESVNALVPELKRRGVEAIVVLLHEGGTPSNTGANGPNLINTCTNPGGALPPIVAAMDDEVDVVITGHTNWAVNCLIDGKVVTGAASQARLITDIDATLDLRTNDFVQPITVNNRIVTQDVAKAADMTSLIAEYNVFAGPIAAEVIGNTSAPLTRAASAGGDSILGRLIADAQQASAAAAGTGSQFALMNPGGIRADLPAGDITYGAAFAVQPFSNIITTKTYTGAQIDTILEQQFTVNSGSNIGQARSTILQPSAGFTYTWDAAAPGGAKVSNIMLNGVPIDPTASYRVTINNFLGTGGDDFPVLRDGTNEQTGSDDLVALVEYLGANNPYTPITESRITRVN